MSQENKRTFIRESDEKQIPLMEAKVDDILRVYEPNGHMIGKWHILEEPYLNESGVATVEANVVK